MALNGRRIGVALGGGVVRGLVHLGALSALEREGISIDCVAGTSAGALIGAFYCAGVPLDRIRGLALHVRWRDLARLVWPGDGFLSFEPLERWLVRELGDIQFSDLCLPFVAVATDLEMGLPVAIGSGRVAPAVRASCSVPGIVTPAIIDGHSLADGGVSNNLPVSAARDLGADYVIGVDPFVLSPLRHRRGPLGVAFAAVEIMVEHSGGGLLAADCLISPRLEGYSYWSFARCDDLIGLGEQAARDKLPEIRAALASQPVEPILSR